MNDGQPRSDILDVLGLPSTRFRLKHITVYIIDTYGKFMRDILFLFFMTK